MNELSRHVSPTRKATLRLNLGKQLGLQAGDALVVVDVQRDFLPGGALAVADGDRIIPRLNAYLATFTAHRLPVFLTRDWHPYDHCSFKDRGGRWPTHCVRETPGADWPADLQVPDTARVVSKAAEKDREAYSAFEGTALASILGDLNVRRLFVGGLATDYCVRATVLDARKHGLQVVVLNDAVRGVDAQAGDSDRALRDMVAQGAVLYEHVQRVRGKQNGEPLSV